MIVDYGDSGFRSALPKFFLEKGGPALFESQGMGIIPTIPNLTKYFNAVLLPAAAENLLLAFMQENRIVGIIFADTGLNKQYKLKEKVATGCFTYVSPECRCRGIGESLRREMLARLIQKGYVSVMTQIKESNEASLISLEKFKDFKRERFETWKVSLKDS